MKKVLLIQTVVNHYRVPVYNELAKRFELTVLYSKGDLPGNIEFNLIKRPTYRLKRFSFYKQSLYTLAKEFDVIIVPFNLSFVSYKLLPRLPRKYKVIYWGIGVSASYNTPYDSNSDLVKKYIQYINISDAFVFYSSYPIEKYAGLGVDRKKLFAANNTVQVLPKENPASKKNILFLGSLYKQKKIYELLENYKAAYEVKQDIPDLILIGGGDEYDPIHKWITDSKLTSKVFLKGEITEEKTLSEYFNSAIVCISPGQAGLSVLKSMGYGVPFVTMRDAITGGEIFNIEDKVNGVILDSYSDLKTLLLETLTNKEKFTEMGLKAKEYYEQNRTVSMMADGFEDAIKYVSGGIQE